MIVPTKSPTKLSPPPHPSRRVRVNAITQARLIKLLLEGGYTTYELAEETGLHYVSVLRYCRELHRVGAAHISGWDQDSHGRDALKLYKLGPGRDAKRRRVPISEVSARYRRKKQMQVQLQLMAGALKETT